MTVDTPHTPQEVAELIAAALAADEPLEIIGRGGRRDLGRPVVADRVLDVSNLSGISLRVASAPERCAITCWDLPASPAGRRSSSPADVS